MVSHMFCPKVLFYFQDSWLFVHIGSVARQDLHEGAGCVEPGDGEVVILPNLQEDTSKAGGYTTHSKSLCYWPAQGTIPQA